MFERKTYLDSQAGALSDAAWIADNESLTYLEGGAVIVDFDATFPGARTEADGTVVLPAGSIVGVEIGEIVPPEGAPLCGLTRYDYVATISGGQHRPVRGVGSSKTMAVVVGGVVHLDRLPTRPTEALAGASLTRFVFQDDTGVGLDPGGE